MGNTQCRVAGCSGKVLAKNLCSKHYTSNRRYGDPLAASYRTRGTCTLAGCDAPHYGRGLCSKHWQRDARNGSPDTVIRIRNSDEERFWTKISKNGPVPSHRPDLGPCWVWISPSVNKRGYGAFKLGKTHVQAHRYAYELLVNLIPEGMTIDHLCRNVLCVNPDHMEVVTRAENLRRLWAWRKAAGWQPRRKTDPYVLTTGRH